MDHIGIVCVSVIGFQLARCILRFLYNKWLARALKFNANLHEMGRWAVITGSTDGLGKAFAFACAKRRMDVALIGRDKSKLEEVASKIESQYKVATRIIQADFSDDSIDTYSQIHKRLVDLEVGVLINYVDKTYTYPDYFLNVDDKLFSRIIKCNIFSVTFMTKILLPQMVERNRGIVINISSSAAQIPSPLLTVYGAAKAYVEKFSRDLSTEYSKRGITVQCLVPGILTPETIYIDRSSWMYPTPEQYVESALGSTGIEPITTGYFPHSVMVNMVKLLDTISSSATEWLIARTMESIRRCELRLSTPILTPNSSQSEFSIPSLSQTGIPSPMPSLSPTSSKTKIPTPVPTQIMFKIPNPGIPPIRTPILTPIPSQNLTQ